MIVANEAEDRRAVTLDPAVAQFGWYLRNCARSPAAFVLMDTLWPLAVRLTGHREDGPSCASCQARLAPTKVQTVPERLMKLRDLLEPFDAPEATGECLERNAAFAREEFGLEPVDLEVLLLILRCERNEEIENLGNEVLRALKDPRRAIAAMIGLDSRRVQRRLMPGSPLIACGMLVIDEGEVGWRELVGSVGCIQLARPLGKVMHRPYPTRDAWVSAIVGPCSTTALGWEDFEHLGDERDLLARLLAHAAGQHGINVLLHGPVGTGKTEFCKALAARAGCGLRAVGEEDHDGGEPSRDDRLASLRLAQRLLAGHANAALLFDEAEDVLACPSLFWETRRDESKAYVNRLLETNAVPILWTCNGIGGIDPAVLRRMTFVMAVRTPDRPARERIWRRVLKAADMDLTPVAIQRLSTRYEAPPAVAANAARVAALTGGGEAEIESAMTGVLRALGVTSPAVRADGLPFDVALVNCSEDLGQMVARLARPESPRDWSMCLHGAPGTGKSQFARHVAERLGMEVMHRRASDLLSCWVGDTEKRIADAFATARARRSVLVIDEADSLLSDRRDTTRSWELTQVNEMLTWMESHPLPFVCTTNLMDRLDRASLRRFTVKLRFDPLRPDQAALAFQRFFGMAAPRHLPDGLTPGDFATVRHKCALFRSDDAGQLADWLGEEVEARGETRRRIGFSVGAHSQAM